MQTLSVEILQQQLRWRYATKQFDPTKKIAPDLWTILEDSMILSPSSFGLQPYKFIVVTDPAWKASLQAISWNQVQVTTCSHFVVMARKVHVSINDIQHYIERIAAVRDVTVESLAPYKDVMVGSVVDGPIKGIVSEWTARQAYIALGNLLTTAAVLGVDACPMEGFDGPKYDEILGLGQKGLAATVVCALGYRSPEDRYGGLAKVRFTKEELIEYI